MASPPPAHMLPPNYYDDQRPQLRGVIIFFLVLGTVAVLIRVALQLRVHRRLYWDDAWIVLAVVLMDSLIGVNLYGLSKGLGLHASRVAMTDPKPPSVFITLWQVGFTNSLLTQLCLFATKVSLLLLYKRLFWVARWFRIGWWINLVYAICWILAAFFTSVFQCMPVSFAWNRMYLWMHIPPPFPVHGTCVSQYFVTVIAALSLASDVGIWALPMAAVIKLQMSLKRKLATCALLSLGLVAVACGIGKAAGSYTSLSSTDVSWSNAPLTIWAEAEQAVAVLCACIPVIAGAARALVAQRRATTSAAYHPGSGPRTATTAGARSEKRQWFRAGALRSDSETGLSGSSDVGSPRRRDGSLDAKYPTALWSDEVEMQTPKKHSEWV